MERVWKKLFFPLVLGLLLCLSLLPAALSAFVDQDAVSSWALGAMAWAVETDTLRGTDGSRLDPGGTATRAEVAAVLYRLLDGIS